MTGDIAIAYCGCALSANYMIVILGSADRDRCHNRNSGVNDSLLL